MWTFVILYILFAFLLAYILGRAIFIADQHENTDRREAP